MRDIRIYDFEFNLLCIMTDVVSSRWHILYNGIGTYEGHFRMKDKISDIILSNKYIVITQGELQAICTGRIISEELVVCGRTVNWILSKRTRPPFKSREIFGSEYTDPETILLYCLKKGFTEPPAIDENGLEKADSIDQNKVVSNFVLPAPIGAEPLKYHFWRLNANDLSQLTIDLCTKLNRGHRVVFDIDNKCWRFEFIYPANNDILLSEATKSIYNVTYTNDMQNKADGGWYPTGKNDDESESSWLYLTGTQNNKGIYFWDSVLSCSGESEAKDTLEKRNITESTKAKLRNLKFNQDYSLGDIVSVYVKFGEFEKLSTCIINGVDIQMTRESSYEEPDLKGI